MGKVASAVATSAPGLPASLVSDFLHSHSVLQEPSWWRPDPAALALWLRFSDFVKLFILGFSPPSLEVYSCNNKNNSNAPLLFVYFHAIGFWGLFL